MKILIGIGHPAHVHFFKNAIWNLEKEDHEVKIVARPRKIATALLNAYKFNYELFGRYRNNFIIKVFEIPYNDYIFYKVAKEFKPDIFMGILNYTSTHIGKLIGKPSIIFTDTEHATLNNLITLPFSTVICTPSCFKKDLGKKQVRYNGYQELAYLHPNYFRPDSSVLDDLGLNKNDKFIIMRLISGEATHDTHSKGFSQDLLERVTKSLEEYGHVFITSEQKLDKDFEKYEITIPPEKLHSALYYASLYFGDGGTTAVEAALLGTPSVHVEAFESKSGNTMDATHIHGNFDELVNKYKMLNTFADSNQAMNKALRILQDKNAKKDLGKKRERLLKEKIDVTAFMADFIENYPKSFYAYQKNKMEHLNHV